MAVLFAEAAFGVDQHMEFDAAARIRKPNPPGGLDKIGQLIIGRLQNGPGFFPRHTFSAQCLIRQDLEFHSSSLFFLKFESR
jgi:hypothetical protein